MKEKIKESAFEREYDTQRGGKGRGGRDRGGGLYSCTLNHTHTGSDYPFHTHRHTHTVLGKHIKRHCGKKKAELGDS